MKELLHASKNVKDAMLVNVLSFLSDKLLPQGNTVATLDDLYIWLSNVTTIEYIFLFNAGSVDRKFYMDNLQIEASEFELIRFPQKGVCLYKCGNERYLLEVKAPEHKAKLFGEAGGR